MTEEEAVAKMMEATKMIDWVNLGRVISSLGDYKHKWGKYPKSRFKPNFDKAHSERIWLEKNAGAIKEAFDILYKNRKNAV